MTTLKAIRRAMIQIGPDDLGEMWDISSSGITTQSVQVPGLNTGGIDSEVYQGKYLHRAEAATLPDAVRLVTGFDSTDGVFTHTGDAYSDTTETSETLEILQLHPRLYNEAIQVALDRTKFVQRSILPGTLGGGKHWLHNLDWIEDPADVQMISTSSSPQLSDNRYFEQWNSYSSAGLLEPDRWTLSGSGATWERSTTQQDGRTKHTVAITRAGTDTTLTQVVGLLETSVAADSLQGETITVVLRGWAAAASQLRVGVDDGVTQTYSDYHTGGSGWELLTKEVTVGATATKLDLLVEVNADNTVAYAGEAYLHYGVASDTAKRDASWHGQQIWGRYQQGSTTLPVELPPVGKGRHYVIESTRAYPRFVDARVRAGTAEGDTSDAPERTIATGAIARLYERLAQRDGEDNVREARIAQDWTRRWERLALRGMAIPGTESGTYPIAKGKQWASPARR